MSENLTGSIEIIRGTGKNAESEGKVFGITDTVTRDTASASVQRLTGARVGEPQENPYPPESCLGVWSGTDRNGKPCTIKVWITDD